MTCKVSGRTSWGWWVGGTSGLAFPKLSQKSRRKASFLSLRAPFGRQAPKNIVGNCIVEGSLAEKLRFLSFKFHVEGSLAEKRGGRKAVERKGGDVREPRVRRVAQDTLQFNHIWSPWTAWSAKYDTWMDHLQECGERFRPLSHSVPSLGEIQRGGPEAWASFFLANGFPFVRFLRWAMRNGRIFFNFIVGKFWRLCSWRKSGCRAGRNWSWCWCGGVGCLAGGMLVEGHWTGRGWRGNRHSPLFWAYTHCATPRLSLVSNLLAFKPIDSQVNWISKQVDPKAVECQINWISDQLILFSNRLLAFGYLLSQYGEADQRLGHLFFAKYSRCLGSGFPFVRFLRTAIRNGLRAGPVMRHPAILLLWNSGVRAHDASQAASVAKDYPSAPGGPNSPPSYGNVGGDWRGRGWRGKPKGVRFCLFFVTFKNWGFFGFPGAGPVRHPAIWLSGNSGARARNATMAEVGVLLEASWPAEPVQRGGPKAFADGDSQRPARRPREAPRHLVVVRWAHDANQAASVAKDYPSAPGGPNSPPSYGYVAGRGPIFYFYLGFFVFLV